MRAVVQRRTDTGFARKLPGGTRVLSVRGDRSVPETVAALRRHNNVEWAVPDYIAHIAAGFYPNDPGAGHHPHGWTQAQWDHAGPSGWTPRTPGPRRSRRARRGARRDRRGARHGRGLREPRALPQGAGHTSRPLLARFDFVDNDTHPNDQNGHGTHVSMTIAEATNNGFGLTGLAYGVKIMPVRVLDSEGAGDAVAISRAIRYAATTGRR